MPESMLSDQIDLLRVQLETALPMPVVLVVSSARDNDGKNVVAAGLARSMNSAGYSTLLVLADERTRDVDGALEPKSLSEISDFGIAPYLVRGSRSSLRTMVIPSEKIRHTVSREGVAKFGATCRETYQVTIIEAAAILTNSFAMLSAVNADGVLLAVAEGRRVCPADRQLAKTLTRENAPFLGVVAVADSAMRSAPSSIASSEPVIRTKARTTTADLEPNREGQAV